MAGRCTANQRGPGPARAVQHHPKEQNGRWERRGWVPGLLPGSINILNKNVFNMDGTDAKPGNWTMWWFLMKPSIFHQAPGTVRRKLIPLQGEAQMQWRTFTGPSGNNYFFFLIYLHKEAYWGLCGSQMCFQSTGVHPQKLNICFGKPARP